MHKHDVSEEDYAKVAAIAKQVFLTRGAAYNTNSLDIFDYFPDEEGWNQILWMKVLREKAQLGKSFEGRNKDSLIDLINYCVYKYVWLEKKGEECECKGSN